MKYQLKIEPASTGLFLHCLADNIAKNVGVYSVRSTPIATGTQHSIEMQIEIPNHYKIQLNWQIEIDDIKGINLIHIDSKEKKELWQQVVINIIKNTILDCKSANWTVLTCHLFGYIGPVLDGEYILPNFRLLPAPMQDYQLGGRPNGVERVVCIYLNTNDATYQLALEAARIQAKKYASVLSLVLGIGLYDLASYDIKTNFKYYTREGNFRWGQIKGLDGIYITQSVMLEYSIVDFNFKSSPGKYRPVNRDDIDKLFYKLGDTLKCPIDINNFFDKIELFTNSGKSEDSEKVKKFYRASALMQFAELQKDNYPSVSLSYAVAAMNALKDSKEKDNGKAIKSIISECFCNISSELIDILYKNIRCAHFHEGEFIAGEFDLETLDPFATFNNSKMDKAIMFGGDILRSTLIKWLLIQ